MEKRKEKGPGISVFTALIIFVLFCGCQSPPATQESPPTGKEGIEGSLEVIQKEGQTEELTAAELAEVEAMRRVATQRRVLLEFSERKKALEGELLPVVASPDAATKKTATTPEPSAPTAGARQYWLEIKHPHIRERTESDGRQTLFYQLRHRGGAVITESEIQGQRLVVTTEKVDLGEIEGLLQNWLSQEGKTIRDEQRNMLIITDAPEYIDLVKELLLEVFDTPEKQVLIEANIFEYSRNWDFQLGQEWTATRFRHMKAAFQDFTTDFGIPGSIIPPWVGAKGTVELLLASDEWGIELDVVIGFLEEVGWINAIAAPRVATQEGKTALIEIGEELPVVTQVEVLRGQISSKTEFKFVGVKLFITPLIIGDETVKLHIVAEVSQVTSFEVIGTENPIPIARIDSRVALSTVTVQNGKTLIMGGLTSNEEVEREVKVPLLGDIPLIGWLFKGYRKATVERDLVFTLKPTIIQDPSRPQ
jgi:type II secretory pathway component GspD/PulD (secretin)